MYYELSTEVPLNEESLYYAVILRDGSSSHIIAAFTHKEDAHGYRNTIDPKGEITKMVDIVH